MSTVLLMWSIFVFTVVSQVATPTASFDADSCPDPRTPLDDISLVLDQYGPVYTRDVWRLNIDDNWSNGHMMFIWSPVNGAPSIAYVDLALWPCGTDEAQLDDYYTDETIDIIVSTWDKRTITARCIVDGVRIYDFDLAREDGEYIARLWIEQVHETRVAQGNLTLPVADAALLSDYAELLYPHAPACK